jgi:transcriptional regulator with XRE-family HTH domain
MVNAASDIEYAGVDEESAPRREPRRLGSRVGLLRTARQMSLRELGKRAGLSPSYLSCLERGQANPSIGTLRRLSVALAVELPELLCDSDPEDSLTTVNSHEDGSIRSVRGSMTTLISPRKHQVEVYETVLEPGDATGDKPASHANAQEFVLVLEGELELSIGDDVHHLKPGAAAIFSSSLKHNCRNRQRTGTRFLWIVAPNQSAVGPVIVHTEANTHADADRAINGRSKQQLT